MRKPAFGILLASALMVSSLSSRPVHRRSSFEEMLITRKEVSHIAYTLKGDRRYLVLILHHAGIWAYHARSHARYYECGDARNCLKMLQRLDQRLKSGQRLHLFLKGSLITKIDGL